MRIDALLATRTGLQHANVLSAINGSLAVGDHSITAEDAQTLAGLRAEALSEFERVEFGTPAIVAIAEAVATSPSLSRGNAARDLAELQAAFYRVRSELPASVPDAEISDALRGCIDALGDVEMAATLEVDDLMRYSSEYMQALEESGNSEYRIMDDEGHVYAFDASEWEYDEQADGWDGERWADAESN